MKVYIVIHSHRYGETAWAFKNEKDAKQKQTDIEIGEEGEFDSEDDFVQVIESELE